MNLKKSLLLLTGLAATLTVRALPLERWDFDDPAGTPLSKAASSGYFGSLWEHRPNIDKTDGNGSLVIRSGTGAYTVRAPAAGSSTFAAPSFGRYKKPLGADNLYIFEVDFASWNITPENADDVLAIKLVGTKKKAPIAGISLVMSDPYHPTLKFVVAPNNYHSVPVAPSLNIPLSVQARIFYNDNHIEFWLNGKKVQSFKLKQIEPISRLVIQKSRRFQPGKGWNTSSGTLVRIDAIELNKNRPGPLPSSINTHPAVPAPQPAPSAPLAEEVTTSPDLVTQEQPDITAPVKGVQVINKYFEALDRSPRSGTPVVFKVHRGDFILALVAADKLPDKDAVKFSGSARLINVGHTKAGSEAGSAAWYALCASDGKVSIDIDKNAGDTWTFGAYQIRSDRPLKLLGTTEDPGTAWAGAFGTYLFDLPASGIIFEACATYNANGAAPQESFLSIDKTTARKQRTVAHGRFSNTDSVSTTWSGDPSERPTSLVGVAVGVTE